jgi:hypothetical protein
MPAPVASLPGRAASRIGSGELKATRLFLMHQPDPVRTLRRIAGLLRPGGWLVAQEPLWTPPRSHPDLPAPGGQFMTHEPVVGFDVHASTIAAARERAAGAAGRHRGGDRRAGGGLRAARDGGYTWVTSPFFLELRLRKPRAG